MQMLLSSATGSVTMVLCIDTDALHLKLNDPRFLYTVKLNWNQHKLFITPFILYFFTTHVQLR